MTKNAFITIVGRPNAGKSSLLNALIGEKIAAVSSKPQTTRTKITGVLTKGEIQYVFIDTPGMHKSRDKLSEHMINAINSSVSSIDAALLVVDSQKKPGDAERELLRSLKASKAPVILVVNKIDLFDDKELLIPVIKEYASMYDFAEVIPISAMNSDGLDIILDVLSKYTTEGPHFFPDDKFTDQPERVIISEIIREKLLELLSAEVPHGIAVDIETLSERDTKDGEGIMDVGAVIYCEKESHKGIVIGKGGAMLKQVGRLAREDIERFFMIKTNLQLWVKVKEGWRNREGLIKNFGLAND
ncbi:MAG TPA: GTPase Era [Candidatus Faeciplasma pullistercoris]|uniref:GTPase Era n=1 Tax=Candidatus Faeciplasma pullistercoris TaxID=2840800 RepID=A0A9D1GTT0_9FIRM|nr:GTPase Era [Candidatus Faeciplasma pullistercoris]